MEITTEMKDKSTDQVSTMSVPRDAKKLFVNRTIADKTAEVNVGEDIFAKYLREKDFVKQEDYANEIERLKLANDNNILKIGKVLNLYLTKHRMQADNPTYLHLLNMENVKIKRTQAEKYITVYNYCYEKFVSKKLTEKTLKLGIEKLYLVTRLEEKAKQEKLAEFVTVKNLSVQKLDKLIKILNKKSEILELSEEFNNSFRE